ncbi:MAG: hypothetical protein AB8G05_12145 [Oligoflexales bacterium]
MKIFYLITQISVSTVCFSSPFPEIVHERSFDDLIEKDAFNDVSNNNFELPPLLNLNQDEALPFCEFFTDPIKCTENDIVIGKYFKTNKHPGNSKFINRIVANRFIYQTLDKKNKAHIVKDILSILKEEKIRFLEFNESEQTWSVVSEEISEKVIEKILNEESF